MTDQRERVSTDPGIGPVDADNTTTLRSIEAAVEVEPDGASLYYEPLPLVAVSDHRTLEMETVKLSQEIDPRKRATELSLPRSPIPPRFDSGWPQADLVLTSSQRPAPQPRRWRVPLLLCTVLVALLTLVLARSAVQRAVAQSAASSLRTEVVAEPRVVKPTSGALPVSVKATSSAAPVTSSAVPVTRGSLPIASGSLPVALPIASGTRGALPIASGSLPVALPVASGALPVASGALPVVGVKSTSSAVPAASAADVSRVPPPLLAVPQHGLPRPNSAPEVAPSGSSSAPSAPTVKPKRAIY